MRRPATAAGGTPGRDTVDEPTRRGRNIISTMIGLEGSRNTGQPTWSADVANRTAVPGPRLGRGAKGIFHATGSGETTWYELAHEVFRHLGADPDRVRPVGSAAFRRPAPRPAYSALAHDRRQQLALPPLCGRRTALHEALPEIRKESLRETP